MEQRSVKIQILYRMYLGSMNFLNLMMKKIQRSKFVLISLICVILILRSHEPDFRYLETVSEMLGIVIGEPINASFPITFYQSAYVDYRFTPPRLRIFTLNPCLKNYQFLSADLHFNGNNSAPVRKNIYGKHLDDDCPSALIKKVPCVYNPYIFSSSLKGNHDLKKVTIHFGSRKVELNVQKVYKKSTEGITVCLQPVYYYSQWQNIELYIEAWRAQGATRFIVYFHSATKETWKTLEYYRDLGMIEIKSWPSFPSLPIDIADKYPKIDDSVFILSYFLAMNICILDIKTTIGTIADFDEVMVPTNGRLLDYATKEMTGTKVGALSFGNYYVLFTPKIYTSHFSGVASPKFKILTWPSKVGKKTLGFEIIRDFTQYLFNASAIHIAQVHWPDKTCLSLVDCYVFRQNR
ncbi:Protein CBG06408 [Caenorhabditis briggsae]|uniref:Glycosyltransferase family 92 protein n=1 Tax=Caenorhabditis briggsae TaxID=6238 RepID=A8X259_CAEBR|nr:Protein CBG06408 [Caenorhabditis briggsae]CAP26719.2 Protein CBG06408 [Caenorhabditis briggsae]